MIFVLVVLAGIVLAAVDQVVGVIWKGRGRLARAWEAWRKPDVSSHLRWQN